MNSSIQLIYRHLLTALASIIFFHSNARDTSSHYLYDSISKEIQVNTTDSFYTNLLDVINHDKWLNKSHKLLLLEEAINVTQEKGLDLPKAKLTYVKSINKTIEGDYSTAFKLVQSILPIFKEKAPNYYVASHNTMGNMIARLGDTKLAITYLEKAIFLCDSMIEDKKESAILSINNYLVLGNIYFNDSQYNLALTYFTKANELANKSHSGINKEKCFCLLNLGKLDNVLNQPQKAIARCKLAEKYANEKGYFDIKAYSYLRLGRAYMKLSRLDSALYYYAKGEDISNIHELSYILLDVYRERSELYEKFQQYNKSLIELRKYNSLKDYLEEQNENAKADYLISEAKKQEKIVAERRLEKIREKENKFILLASILFVAMLFIIFFFWSRTQRIKLKNQIKKEQLDMIVVSSQLKAISSQMNPHFIFNCLNSIQDLVLQQDGTNAYNYIEKFALLIRKTLHHSEKEFIDIDDELSLLNLYLELEKLRFKKDFSYQIDINEIRDIQIPPMLIQPFVENAIKHGLLHKEGIKSLKVNFQLKESNLTCSISDNGIGRNKSKEIQERKKSNHKSFSSKSVNDRFELLKKLHGGELGLNIVDLIDNQGNPTGTIVELKLPHKRLY